MAFLYEARSVVTNGATVANEVRPKDRDTIFAVCSVAYMDIGGFCNRELRAAA